jgi:hypothetical protein
MSCAFFTILPGSTKFPAHSVDVYSPAPAGSPTDRHWILLVSIGHLQYSHIFR